VADLCILSLSTCAPIALLVADLCILSLSTCALIALLIVDAVDVHSNIIINNSKSEYILVH
jgi:hypothetical protein